MASRIDEQPRERRGFAATLLDDRHDLLSEDVFGHGGYARTLAEALRIAPDGLTVGLFGEWGIGKSSVLHALPGAMGPKAAVVVFDAWRYGEDAFRREFLREVAERLVSQKAIGRFDVTRDLADLDIDTATPEEFLHIGRPRLVGFALSIFLLVLAWLAVDGRIAHADTGGKVALVTIIGLVGLIVGRVELLTRIQTRTETRRRLEDADRFARRFRELLGAVKADHLVIAIDNVDRLEPDAAIEVLSTVKTYLEPAMGQHSPTVWRRLRRVKPFTPKINFVVAVDADALVAHLQASRQVTPARSPDEFLRKFFAARITMRALLDDDLQPFVRRRVEPLVDAWTPDRRDLDLETPVATWREHQISSLTDLIVAGVRRNPRRLKQFINSIQMAMLLLDLRHRENQLRAAPIELDLVAQLVFLEEDCPELFKSVLENPDRLNDLHLAAQGAATPPVGHDAEWRRLVPVLRSTFSVDRRNARTYLRLKVSDAERRLPDHDAIWAALRAGDADEVELRLDPYAYVADVEAESRPAVQRSAAAAIWAAHLPELVRSELMGGRTDIVINIIRCLLEVDVLFGYDESATATVDRAMADPEIRAGAWRLPVKRLLEVLDRLPEERREPVFDGLARWYSAPIDATTEQLDALATGLADRDLPLSDPTVAALRESFAAQPRLGQLDYAPIVRARPNIFPDAAIDPFLTTIEDMLKPPVMVQGPAGSPGSALNVQAREAGVKAIRRWLDGPGRIVFVALATAGRVPLDDRLGRLLFAMVDGSQWDDEVRCRVLSTVSQVVRSAPTAEDQAIDELTTATRVYVSLGQYVSTESVLAVAACLARHPAPGDHCNKMKPELQRLPIDRWAAVVRDADAELEGPMRTLLLEHATERLSTQPNDVSAAAIVARLSPSALLADASPDAIHEAFSEWVADNDHQDSVVIAVGSAGFDDRSAVQVDGVGLEAVQCLEPHPGDPDTFRATLVVSVEAQISIEPEDLEPGAAAQSTVDLDVICSLRLRRDLTDHDEISIELVDVAL